MVTHRAAFLGLLAELLVWGLLAELRMTRCLGPGTLQGTQRRVLFEEQPLRAVPLEASIL